MTDHALIAASMIAKAAEVDLSSKDLNSVAANLPTTASPPQPSAPARPVEAIRFRIRESGSKQFHEDIEKLKSLELIIELGSFAAAVAKIYLLKDPDALLKGELFLKGLSLWTKVTKALRVELSEDDATMIWALYRHDQPAIATVAELKERTTFDTDKVTRLLEGLKGKRIVKEDDGVWRLVERVYVKFE